MITPEDEIRYRLKPLPNVEPVFGAEAKQRQVDYEAARRRWREMYPLVAREDCE